MRTHPFATVALCLTLSSCSLFQTQDVKPLNAAVARMHAEAQVLQLGFTDLVDVVGPAMKPEDLAFYQAQIEERWQNFEQMTLIVQAALGDLGEITLTEIAQESVKAGKEVAAQVKKLRESLKLKVPKP